MVHPHRREENIRYDDVGNLCAFTLNNTPHHFAYVLGQAWGETNRQFALEFNLQILGHAKGAHHTVFDPVILTKLKAKMGQIFQPQCSVCGEYALRHPKTTTHFFSPIWIVASMMIIQSSAIVLGSISLW